MIEWRLVKTSNHKLSLEVRCPECGEWGKLVSVKPPKMTGRSFRIVHEDGRTCKIAWTHPEWEAVARVYKKVRNKDVERLDSPDSSGRRKRDVAGYRCPYPYCNFSTKSLYGLIRHVKVKHPVNGHCPLCNRPMKHLNHFRQTDEEMHQLFYVLYSNGRRKDERLLKLIEVRP